MTASPEPLSATPARSSVSERDERWVRFQLVFNVRDLGGLPAGDGFVNRGLAYRADGVHRLAGPDLETARSLGLQTVIDLRTPAEVQRGRFPVEEHPVDWHHLPMIRRIWSEDGHVPVAGQAAPFLRDRYLDMLETNGDSLARIIELLSVGRPTLFHCAAGKDRTGVVAAVTLGLLGVAPEDIAADYHASSHGMADFARWVRKEFPEADDAMSGGQPPEYLEAPPEAMLGFLEQVDARYGSMEGLARHLGVAEATVERLRQRLWTDSLA